ncbi:MAG: MBL fold metallo-hydrolase [Candidatus Paceibacterota bacterium]|jgi:metallo-beta-lactamase family protein
MTTTKKLKLSFYGGTGEVTGSNFLVEAGGKKILVDCGLYQGSKIGDARNLNPLLYNAAEVDALFVTHAHIDHIGRIPKLVKDGFRGDIYSTAPTKGISDLSLVDSLGVLGKEAKRDNHPVIYHEEDVTRAMKQWKTVKYHEPIVIGDFSVVFRDAGHILGSAMVEITYNGKKILFTGDLGNSPAPLLRDTEAVTDADYMVIESVYGDRNHESVDERKKRTEQVIEETISSGGVLMIPAFSIERTQDLLLEINNLVENKRIPPISIFLDSPLAIKVTKVYRESQDFFNKEALGIIHGGDDIFNFPGLKLTPTTEESKGIIDYPNPKIIIAGSGMSNGGRIVHHEQHYLGDPKNTLLLIGYQAAGTPGRMLQEGAKKIRINGEDIDVRARIVNISGYSAHKDGDHLFKFVKATADTLKTIFVVHGEPKTTMFFVQRLRDYLGLNAYAPQAGESVELDF